MTPLSEIATLNIGSRPASRTRSDRIETCAPSPGVLVGAGARDAARLVWHRPSAARLGQGAAARDGRGLALPRAARQPGNGDGEERPWPSPAATWSGRSIAGEALFRLVESGWWRHPRGGARDHRAIRLLEANPALDASIRLRLLYIEPLNLLQVELLRRGIGPASRIRASPRASSCRSAPPPRRCATAADASRRSSRAPICARTVRRWRRDRLRPRSAQHAICRGIATRHSPRGLDVPVFRRAEPSPPPDPPPLNRARPSSTPSSTTCSTPRASSRRWPRRTTTPLRWRTRCATTCCSAGSARPRPTAQRLAHRGLPVGRIPDGTVPGQQLVNQVLN